MLNRLGDTLDFQAQALGAACRNDSVLIASNIANADTPGYVARDHGLRAQRCARRPAPLQPARTLQFSAAGPPRRRCRGGARTQRGQLADLRDGGAGPTSIATPSTWTASAPAFADNIGEVRSHAALHQCARCARCSTR